MSLLKAANATIARLDAELHTQKASIDPLDNPMLQATGYHTEHDVSNGDMRLVLFHGAEKNVIAWMTLPTDEIYVLADKCLETYDKLIGIE